MDLRKYLILLIFFIAPAQAQLPPPVSAALLRGGIHESNVGVYVHEVGAAEPVVSHRADVGFNPASVMKLVTSYAALEMLGPAYQWSTDILTDGTLQRDVLTGNVYLKGGGDPKLAIEHFWLMLRSLRNKGVREIRGDLVLDRSLFTTQHPDPGLFDNEPLEPYNTTPDALLTNFKTFTLSFAPDDEMRAVRITADPPLPQLRIVNNLILNHGPCGAGLARMKVQTQDYGDSAQLTFSGPYSTQCGEQFNYYSVMSHRGYVGALFQHIWQELGGTLKGRVREAETNGNTVKLVSQRSLSLSEIVRDVNKFSNNVMTRQLLLTIGAHANTGSPATPERSARAVREFFAGRGIPMSQLVIDNGSGLSRSERVAARELGQMLVAAFRSPVMPEFIASMPLVGVDGTMRRRLAASEVAGQAHIKTGMINGVRALGGYVLDARGRRVAVVMLINHGNAHHGSAVQDALLRWVHAR
jgi:D-alanyl-D-alanine carboxypeptidase/D-alanyl-D-alanine-endopeptidase (penicillin-binding protein 4)